MIYREAKNSIKYYEEEEIFTNEYRENVDGTSEWIADNGIFFKEPEDRPIEENKIFIAAIQFYRSKDHVDGKYGKDDTSYNGEFGFDKFDKKVYAEGLIGEYEELKGIIPKEKIISGIKKYLSAYLSIWPPNVEGNKDNRKSKVKLYVKAEEAIPKLADSADIEFTSSDPNIIINGSSTIKLTIDAQAQELNIECTGSFEKDVYIEAKAKGEPQVLGKLIIKANAVRYKTTIQPVELSFGTIKSFSHQENTAFIKNLLNDLNNIAFNQAYMYAELASETDIVTLKKKEFEDARLLLTKENSNIYLKYESKSDVSPRLYSDIIEQRYAAIKIGREEEELQATKENLQQKIRELLTQFGKEYTFEKNASLKYTLKQYRNKIAKTAWEDSTKVQEAYKEYKVVKIKYDSYGGKKIKLNKKKKLHLFYTKDIHAAGNSNDKALAYSYLNSGVAHIFNSALISKDGNNVNSVIIHELGHSLGLYHTFQLGNYAIKEVGKRYKDDIQKEIDKLQRGIEERKEEKKNFEKNIRLAEKENLSTDQIEALTDIQIKYRILQRCIDFKDTIQIENFEQEFMYNLIGDKDVIGSDQNIIKLEKSNSLSLQNARSFSTIEQIDKEIANAEEKLEKLKEEKKETLEAKILSRAKEQAHTEENYMDYNEYDEVDINGNPKINENFMRKTFYQWQWRDMQKAGVDKNNSYFEEIK